MENVQRTVTRRPHPINASAACHVRHHRRPRLRRATCREKVTSRLRRPRPHANAQSAGWPPRIRVDAPAEAIRAKWAAQPRPIRWEPIYRLGGSANNQRARVGQRRQQQGNHRHHEHRRETL